MQVDTPPALSPLAGYGVVGMIAALGLWFAWRQWVATEGERKTLQGRVDELNEQLLAQAEKHKSELLEIYQAVGPSLASTAQTLQQYQAFLEQLRRDRELEQARAGARRERT